MRPIKFRAWDNDIMLTWQGILNAGIELFLNDKDSLLMQFTGLLDKNGKEIYDGDVVKRLNQDYLRERNRIVEWTNNQGRNGWNIGRGDLWEIIGNIYENSDLMK